MGETLEALHRLQVVELQLGALRRNREVKSRRVELHQKQLKQLEGRLRESQLAIRERQAKLDALSLDVAVREESAARHREALNKAKTNKEYGAILAAMNTEKADNTKIETGMLALMEEIQTLKDAAAALESENAKALEALAAAERTLAELDSSCRQQRERLLADRKACEQAVAAGTLASFNRVAEHHDGEAMAPIAKAHPKREDYICSGCNMKITLEVVNALQTRDEIQLCKSCGRILYCESSAART